MNNRSLTRGDAVVMVAAVVLFIASFLNLYGGEGVPEWSAWRAEFFPALPSVFLAGIIAAGLIVGSRFLSQKEKEYAGLRLDQWGTALAVFAAWTMIWIMMEKTGPYVGPGPGQIVGLIFVLILAATAIAAPLVPALKAPLSSGNSGQPSMQQPYGGQPGYGYPGGMQQPYGGQPGMQQPYGGQPGMQQPQPGAQAPQPADFQPFWFAVPATRPLFGEDGSPNPVAELAPGTWYLAVEQRGQALIAQTQDGRRGVLQDTMGIQRA